MTSLERLSAAHAIVPPAWALPSLPSLWGLALGTRDVADGAPRALRDHDRLWEAFARDELSRRDPVRVAGRVAPAGRHLAASLLPALVRDEALGVAWSRARLAGWLHTVGTTLHVEVASRCAVALERLGDAWLSRSGASWCLDDLRGPPGRDAILARAMTQPTPPGHSRIRRQDDREGDVGARCDRSSARAPSNTTAPTV